MEEERRTLRQRCADVESSLSSAESSSCRLGAELAACRGQLSAVQARLEHAEHVSEMTSRRDGELQQINADLRRDADTAQQQVRAFRYRIKTTISNFQKIISVQRIQNLKVESQLNRSCQLFGLRRSFDFTSISMTCVFVFRDFIPLVGRRERLIKYLVRPTTIPKAFPRKKNKKLS